MSDGFRCPQVVAKRRGGQARQEFRRRGNPSAGYVAWPLWGGDEGRKLATEMKKKVGNAPDI